MKRITLITLVVAAAVMPTFAQARPIESAANDRAHYAAPQGYSNQVMGLGVSEGQYKALGLSDGVGGTSPDDRSFTRSTPVAQAPVMGLGVSEGQYKALGLSDGVVGTSPDDRSFTRSTPVEPAPVVLTKDTGWSIDLGNSAFAGLALLLGLLAGGMSVTFYNHRRTKLSPAS